MKREASGVGKEKAVRLGGHAQPRVSHMATLQPCGSSTNAGVSQVSLGGGRTPALVRQQSLDGANPHSLTGMMEKPARSNPGFSIEPKL